MNLGVWITSKSTNLPAKIELEPEPLILRVFEVLPERVKVEGNPVVSPVKVVDLALCPLVTPFKLGFSLRTAEDWHLRLIASSDVRRYG